MLKRAVKAAFVIGNHTPALVQNIKWLCDQADRLADARNDYLHSPTMYTFREGKLVVAPLWIWNNPRANKLKDREMLVDIRHQTKTANTLAKFAYAMQQL
jgi:hypothetical protein